MSSDPQNGPTDCSSASCDDKGPNMDMSGIAVAVTNVVVGLCFRILVTWSPADVDVAVQGTLIQFYPILLSTLLSINRNQLTVSDAYFALLLSSSPLTIYLVFTSVCDLFGFNTGLYKRIKCHRRTIRTLTLLVPLLWLGLNMTIALSDRAFKDSNENANLTSGERVYFVVLPILSTIMYPGGRLPPFVFYPMFGSLFGLCLFRRRSQVMVRVRAYWKGASKPWGRLCVPWMFVKYAWRSIEHHHKWCIHLLFVYLDTCWATFVISYAIYASSKGYVASYGQLLSMFAIIPPFLSTVKFVYSHRWDLLHLLLQLPRLCLVEVVYLVTGIELDPPVKYHCLPITRPTSLFPKLRFTIQLIGADGGEDARSCTSSAMSHPHGSLPGESRRPHGVRAGPSGPPVHPGSQHDHAPSERARSPTPLVTDVPLAAVRDVILAVLRNATAIESVESFCVTHEFSPLITESIMQVVRETLSPVNEQQRDTNDIKPNSSVMPTSVASTSTTPPAVHKPTVDGTTVHTNIDTDTR